MKKVSKSIFSSEQHTVPMADVQHIEKRYHGSDSADKTIKKGDLMGGFVITKHTKYNTEIDDWENAIWMNKEELEEFLNAWCFFRYEIEGGPEMFKRASL